MNRIQFMTELAALLQDISVEERVEAMKYYNDYFDEAGEENEEEIVRELGSPAKVAAEVKAGLGEASSDAGEFRETGYTDTRFEQKEAPAYPEQEKDSDEAGGGTEKQQGKYTREEQRSNNNWDTGSEETKQKNTGLKIVLIILVILVGLPVIVPAGIALICAAVAVVVAVVALFAGLAFASVMVVLLGVTLVGAGIACLIPEASAGLVLIGGGLITFVIGLIMTVASVRACMIVLPGFFRGIINLIRRPFHRRKAVA